MPSISLPNGISLSYRSHPDERPSPSRPTLVLLPSFLQRAEIQFTPQLQDPRFAGYNLVAVDVHGQGDTTGRETWDYADNAKDVVEALKLMGVDKFFILGTSHGGLTTQEIAIRHPDSVRGIILVGTTPIPFGPEFSEKTRGQLLPIWMSSVPPPDLALRVLIATNTGAQAKPADAPGSVFGDRAPGATVLDGAERTAESAAGVELLGRIVDNWRTHVGEARVVRPIEVMLNWPGSADRLGNVTAPALVIHGINDPSVAFDRAEKTISLLPKNKHTRLHKIDGKHAHLVNVLLDVGQEVNETVKAWLDECVEAGQ